jgi:ABC-type glycerol-3-phosphate transport system substrate-binding protein
MIFVTACKSKENDTSLEGDTELPTEINSEIDNNIPVDAFPAIDADSVLYENAIENEEPVVDVFYDENIYAFYGDKIKVFDYNAKTKLQTILLEGLEDVNVPVIYNELNPIIEVTQEPKSNTYVTAFTVYKNEYYVISDIKENTETVTKILRFDNNGKLMNEYPIHIDNVAEKIVIKNDKAVILSFNVESIHELQAYYDLVIYDFSEQIQSKADINKVIAVSMTDNNKAAIVGIGEEGHSRLMLMDLESSQIEKEADVHIDFIMDLDYQDDNLYLLTASNVYSVDSSLTTQEVSLLNNYVRTTYNRKVKIYEDKMVILHSSNYLLLYDINELKQKEVDSEPNTLTILMPYSTSDINNYYAEYVNELKKKYPNIKLKSYNVMNELIYNFEYNEKVTKKLMAKDTDFDLFFMLDNDPIIKSDYYEDLSKYEQITQNLDSMLPGIKNLMSYNNKIYGVPQNITFRGIGYHSENPNDLSLQFSDKYWTVSEFYEFAIDNKAIIEKEQLPLLHFYHVLGIDNIFNTNFYVSYLQGADLSSEDLASNFEMLKKLVDDKLILIDPNYKGDTIIFERYINSLVESEPRLAPIIATDSCEYIASIQFISLNPSSPNKELAAEFLSAFTDSEIRKKSVIQDLSAQIQISNQSGAYEIPNIFYEYTELDRFQSHKLFRELLEKSNRDISFQGAAEIGDLFEDFMNGKRTAKSAADEIIQRLNMIKYE